MTKLPLRVAWLLIAAASWTATTQTANALSIPIDISVPVNDLGLTIFDRATSECASGFATCPGFSLPGDFCCPSDSVCNVLAGNTTLLCCPTGQSCTIINPITCDITQQDPETHPEAPIKTSALNGVLTKCGGSCCPFGYNCNGNNLCVMEVNQNAAPLQNVPTTTSTKSTSTTSSKTTSTSSSTTLAQAGGAQMTTTADSSITVAVYTGTSTVATAASTSTGTSGTTGTDVSESAVASADDKSKNTSTATIVGGVIGGLAGLLLVGAAIWFLCGRRLRKNGSKSIGGIGGGGGGSRLGSGMKQRDPMNFMSDTNKLTRSTSSFGNIINNPLSISSPKPQGDATAFRTDFIRKLPSSGDYSRPVTPASSFGGGIGSSGLDAASSTVGSVGYNNNRPQQQQQKLGSPSPLGIRLDRELPSPPSPSPPPLVLRRSRDSTSVTPIRGMRNSGPRTQPSKHNPREPSMEEINVGVDPSIIAFGGNFTISPPGTLLPPGRAAAATAALASVTSNANNTNVNNGGLTVPGAGQDRNRNNDRLTTFSSLLQAANLDPERPYVPNSVQSSPASRRK
ncbi:hypothetical protein Sste5346_004642 [Sporothrix stenoceras]|uniref:Mid2 domain-containing protein n=1 Tax=Sporothrix stenoceras TaxID=5173 RepID=A0ABR3Z9U6_9PEZI